MDWTEQNIENATQAVELLLNALALEEYRFTVAPRGSQWEVGVEYPAAEGWKTATLRVPGSTLLQSRKDEELQNALAGRWLVRLKGARRRTDRAAVLAIEASALGHAWAEDKVAELREQDVPGADWPDFWDDSDSGTLPADLPLKDRREMQSRASAAARERWRELVADEASSESLETDEAQTLAAAERLRADLEARLPDGVSVGSDGSRVFLHDTVRGMERTVDSEAAARRVLEEWSELQPEGPS
jgi:hypothetical protein